MSSDIICENVPGGQASQMILFVTFTRVSVNSESIWSKRPKPGAHSLSSGIHFCHVARFAKIYLQVTFSQESPVFF